MIYDTESTIIVFLLLNQKVIINNFKMTSMLMNENNHLEIWNPYNFRFTVVIENKRINFVEYKYLYSLYLQIPMHLQDHLFPPKWLVAWAERYQDQRWVIMIQRLMMSPKKSSTKPPLQVRVQLWYELKTYVSYIAYDVWLSSKTQYTFSNISVFANLDGRAWSSPRSQTMVIER